MQMFSSKMRNCCSNIHEKQKFLVNPIKKTWWASFNQCRKTDLRWISTPLRASRRPNRGVDSDHNDSRCPINATCYYVENAAVAFTASPSTQEVQVRFLWKTHWPFQPQSYQRAIITTALSTTTHHRSLSGEVHTFYLRGGPSDNATWVELRLNEKVRP